MTPSRNLLAAFAALVITAATQPAFAQRFYDGGNSQVWDSSTANWSLTTGGPYNQAWASSTAVFEGTGANVSVSGTIAGISGIRFDVAGYTLSGGSLPFPTHNSPLTVNADATISATITGAGGIRKEGTGTLVLSGSNTYTGATFLGVTSSAADAGVLSIADVASLGTGTDNNGRINFVGNGRLRYTGSGSQAITTKFLFSDLANSSMTIDVSNATGSLTITPSGGTRNRPFTKAGSGTLAMNGAFATSATITANGGTLILGADNSNTGATTIASGATLRVGAGSTTGALGSGAISNAGTLVVNRSNALTMAQAISGAGSLVKEGTGTLTITGNNSYSGGTTVTAGTLAVGAGSTAGTLPGNASVAGTLTFNRSNAVTYAGVLSGSGTLRKEATNTLTLTGDSTIAAATVVAGTLSIGAGGGTGSFAGTIANSGTVTFDRIGSLTHAAAISGTGGVVKAGTGTLTLSGTNTYGGGTQVTSGTLLVNGALGTGIVSLGAGTTLGGSGTIAGTIAGAGTVSVGNSPGILTAASVDPAGGLGWDFEITGSAPAWATPAASVNDVLRLTDATSPFAASLTGANAVNFLFALPGVDPISAGTYTVGFFTDRSSSFAADVASAAVEYWVLGEFGSLGDRQQFNVGAGGSAVWYTRLSAYDPVLSASLSVVPMTADFGSGNVSGFSTSVVVVPEPGTLALAGLGLAAALATSLRQRRRGPRS